MKDSKLFTIIKWVASITGFIGAMLIALNIPESKYAFMIFFVSSSMWIYSAHIMKEYSLIFLNVGFLTVDIIGIYRWIIM